LLRQHQGRAAQPTACTIDSQMIKAHDTVGKATSGYHGGKKITGRGRHVADDTEGWLLALVVTAASASDKAGAKILLIRLFDAFATLKIMWVDTGCNGKPLARYALTVAAITVEVVDHTSPHSFQVLRRRWVVERTLGRLMRYRRLAPLINLLYLQALAARVVGRHGSSARSVRVAARYRAWRIPDGLVLLADLAALVIRSHRLVGHARRYGAGLTVTPAARPSAATATRTKLSAATACPACCTTHARRAITSPGRRTRTSPMRTARCSAASVTPYRSAVRRGRAAPPDRPGVSAVQA
jgi:transposase